MTVSTPLSAIRAVESSVLYSGLWGQTAWVPVLPLSFTSSDNLFNLSVLQFLLCKMGLKIVPI